jgi:hypothetical protein
LVADSIEDVNKEVDCNNMSYARKAMICCGLALDVDGSWSVNKLFPHLQVLLQNMSNTFKAKMCPTMLGEDKCVFYVFGISYEYKISVFMYFLYSMDNFLGIP